MNDKVSFWGYEQIQVCFSLFLAEKSIDPFCEVIARFTTQIWAVVLKNRKLQRQW